MTHILAIDPGPDESAFVVYGTAEQRPLHWAKAPNPAVRREVRARAALVEYDLAIEMVASYGMAVGADVFRTCVEIGRFVQVWAHGRDSHHRFIYRRDVKLHLCGDLRAKDANVRQALIDRYGGKDKAVGRKGTPGPLYGLTGDCWAALAVAVTAAEMDRAARFSRAVYEELAG